WHGRETVPQRRYATLVKVLGNGSRNPRSQNHRPLRIRTCFGGLLATHWPSLMMNASTRCVPANAVRSHREFGVSESEVSKPPRSCPASLASLPVLVICQRTSYGQGVFVETVKCSPAPLETGRLVSFQSTFGWRILRWTVAVTSAL